MNVGQLIKEARKACGLTQKQLADRLGVTQSMIGQYERNPNPPKIETLARISDALSVPLNFFIDYKNRVPEEVETDLNGYYEALESASETGQKVVLKKITDELNTFGLKKVVSYAQDIHSIKKYRKDK